jgi:hypothetical protein
METWAPAHLTDFWDERVGAIDAAARRLGNLTPEECGAAIEQVVRSVAERMSALDDEILTKASVAIVDDLYKAACASDRWDGFLGAYLRASAGTFSDLLRERGITVQYLVDNTWDDMMRPFELFPLWFGASRLTYICPQKLEAESEQEIDIDTARAVANELVRVAQEERRNFVHVETDYAPGAFTVAGELRGEPGVVTVFRNDAPEAGTEVMVWFPGDRGD